MTAEQQRLVVDNMALVPFLVNKHFSYQRYFEKQDLYSIGYIAMCNAARFYDPEKGFLFATYAGKYIRSAILNEIQKATRECRDVRNCITTFDQPIDTKEGRDTLGGLIPAVDTAETITDAKLLVKWLDGQDGKDATIVRLHVAGYTQREIATRTGMTQSNVSRHLRSAKERIKEYYAMAI